MSEDEFIAYLKAQAEDYIASMKTRTGHVAAARAWAQAIDAISPWTVLTLIDAYEVKQLAENTAKQLELIDV